MNRYYRLGLEQEMRRLKAREALDLVENVAAGMSEDGGKSRRLALANIAFEDDEKTLAIYLEAATQLG